VSATAQLAVNISVSSQADSAALGNDWRTADVWTLSQKRNHPKMKSSSKVIATEMAKDRRQPIRLLKKKNIPVFLFG
jgi:N-acetylmuramoyl-L-alanine amidase